MSQRRERNMRQTLLYKIAPKWAKRFSYGRLRPTQLQMLHDNKVCMVAEPWNGNEYLLECSDCRMWSEHILSAVETTTLRVMGEQFARHYLKEHKERLGL